MRECESDEFESQAYTTSTDRVCTLSTECNADEDEWELVAPTATTDRECTDAVQHCDTYAPGNDHVCLRCIPGHHLTAADECTRCSPGSTCNGLTITPCPRGQYQNEGGSTSCKPCPPGTYTSSTGRAVCKPCTGASLQAGRGMTGCDAMQAGHFGIVNATAAAMYDGIFTVGFHAQQPCDAGSKCVDGQADFCPPGTFSVALATECTPCGPEGYSLSAQSTSCNLIPDGWYGSGPAANVWSSIDPCERGAACVGGVMTACPRGTYQSEAQQAACEPCGTSSFNPTVGADSQDACTPVSTGFYGVGGTENAREDQAPCEPGFYCVAGKRFACALGTYQDAAQRTECMACTGACPEGEVVDPDAVCNAVSGRAVCLDVTPPVIALRGPNSTTIPYGSAFLDPGAGCSDARDGEFDAVRETVPTPTAVGTHALLYRCTDEAGLQAEATRTLVIVDQVPPVIEVQGDLTITLLQFEDFTDPGANATDNADPSVSVGACAVCVCVCACVCVRACVCVCCVCASGPSSIEHHKPKHT